jgi:cobalt-zinc-cadmium efflux system protein
MVHSGSQEDVNLRSAYLHLMGDVLSTIGAVIAGIAIRFTGLYWLDPLVSFLIGGLILWNAWGIVRETINILLEGTPRDVNMDEMVKDIEQVEGVHGVHDLHVWSITRSLRALSAHIVTDDISISDGAAIQHNVSDLVRSEYGIDHATLQLECAGCFSDDLYCGIGAHEEHVHEHVVSH